jgi:isopropylmalate/homocitrate/citramalate synthase
VKVGRRIYYDLITGNIIIDTGERQGFVVPTTIEQDIQIFKALSDRNSETFDVIELGYGAFRSEFRQATSYRVNPTTKEIEFNYDHSFNLEQYKTFKIDELSQKCKEDIYKGFTSNLNGHFYRTNTDDQLNFLGKFNQLMSDETLTTVMWKTEDVGYIEHTREDWLSVYNEALTAKEQKLFKYDQLRDQVNACTTKEEVEAVVW